MEGETPRQEEQVPGQEGQVPENLEAQQIPVPEAPRAEAVVEGTKQEKVVETAESIEANRAERMGELNGFVKELFGVEEGYKGDPTEHRNFKGALSDSADIAKKRGYGMSENDLSRYYNEKKVTLAKRATEMTAKKQEIQDKYDKGMAEIKVQKAEEERLAEEKTIQDIAKIESSDELNAVTRSLFGIEEGYKGEPTEHKSFKQALSDAGDISKKRGYGLSENDLSRYYNAGKIKIANRATVLAEKKKEIQEKHDKALAEINAQKAEGEKPTEEKIDQDIAGI